MSHTKIPVGPYHIYADREDGTGHLYFAEKGYEPHIKAELERLIPNCEGFLDIGANVGYHTMLAKSIKPSLPVISVEVHPDTAQLLCRAVGECGFEESVTILPLALSDHNGIAQIDARFSNATFHAHCGWAPETEGVRYAPCIKLDSLDLPKIDLVKMDIDGGEWRALHGAKNLLGQRPTWIFEYHLGVIGRGGIEGPELLYFFKELGYRLTLLDFTNNKRIPFIGVQAAHDYVKSLPEKAVDVLAEPL